jgi:hypothetical protein
MPLSVILPVIFMISTANLLCFLCGSIVSRELFNAPSPSIGAPGALHHLDRELLSSVACLSDIFEHVAEFLFFCFQVDNVLFVRVRFNGYPL